MDYRSSIERHHAPYRGLTRREDAVNFDLATVHDLFHIQKIAGGNPAFPGHRQFIEQNIKSLYSSDTDVKAQLPTAGTLVKSLDTVPGTEDLTQWASPNDTNVTETAQGYEITAGGQAPQSKIETVISLNANETIQFRFKATALEDNQTLIGAGALNFEGQDYIKIDPLSDYTDGAYFTYRLHSTATQDVRLVLYGAYETTSGQPVKWMIEDFSIRYLQETPVYIKSLETDLKTHLDNQKETLKAIEKEQRMEAGSQN